jgi:hypothetical protein
MAASTVERNVAVLLTEQDSAMDLVYFPARYRGRFGEEMPVPAGMRLKGALQQLEWPGIVRLENRPTANGGQAAWVSPGPAAATIAHSHAAFQYQGRALQQLQQQPLQPLPQVPQRAQLPAQEVTMSAAFLNVFIGGEFKNLNRFKKQYGVEVEVLSQRGALQGRIKVQGEQDAVQIAVSEILEAACQTMVATLHLQSSFKCVPLEHGSRV